MTNANGRGDNDEPIAWGVSHIDGITPVQINFKTGTRVMMVDATTDIQFDPTIKGSVVPSNVKLALATSSADNTTIFPWVVNVSTGAVLIES